eukprot:3082905-Pyramimonas_sp.AAC.1
MWEGVLAVVKRNGKWSSEFKLGTNGPRGLLFVQNSIDCWELFTLAPSQTTGKIEVKPIVENLVEWGFDETQYNRIISDAMQRIEAEDALRTS